MAKNKTRIFRINNMTGGMNTTSEEDAYLTIDPNASLGAGLTQLQFEMKKQQNWFPINRGGMSQGYGFSLFKNVGSSTKITGLYRFMRSDGTSLFIVSYGTNVYKLVSGTLTSIGATVTNGNYLHFETAYDYLIICDGVVSPQKYNGSATSALGGTPPVGAKQSLFYANRLWMFSAYTNQSLLYYSDAGNIESGYSTNFVQCDVNDGQKITSIAKFFIPGELQPVIIVGKERSMGIVTGDGTASNPFTFKKIAQDVGIPGFRQIVQFNQDAAFLTPRGVNSYQTAVKDINIESQILTGKVRNQFTGLSATYLPDALSWFDWKNKRIAFAVTDTASTYPNKIWFFDIELNCWYYQDGFNVTAAVVDTDGTVYTGDDTGNIMKHDPTVFSYNGSQITGQLQFPYIDFYDPYGFKRIVDAAITVRGNGAYPLGISSMLDYGTKTGSAHSIALSAGSYTWNGGVWTSNPATYQWGGSPIRTKKFFPKNIFKNISFTFTNQGANQPIDLFELVMEVEYLNQH